MKNYKFLSLVMLFVALSFNANVAYASKANGYEILNGKTIDLGRIGSDVDSKYTDTTEVLDITTIKADKVTGGTTGNFTSIDSEGNIQDSSTSPDSFLKVDGSNAPDADLSLGGHKITNLAEPTVNTDAATKSYVDSLVNGLVWKNPIIAGQSAPPSSPAEGDRYLVVSGTGDWTGHDNAIAEYSSSAWVYTAAEEGFAVYAKDDDAHYVFNGTDWVTFGSVTNHNSLSGLQGGNGTDEFFHLSAAQHTALTDAGGVANADTMHTHNFSALQGTIATAQIADGAITIPKLGTDVTNAYYDSSETETAISAAVAQHEATYDHSLLHQQNTDTYLDMGGANQVAASDIRAHMDDASKHFLINDSATTATDEVWSANKIGTYAGATYLKLDGTNGPMTGVLDMNGNAIDYGYGQIVDAGQSNIDMNSSVTVVDGAADAALKIHSNFTGAGTAADIMGVDGAGDPTWAVLTDGTFFGSQAEFGAFKVNADDHKVQVGYNFLVNHVATNSGEPVTTFTVNSVEPGEVGNVEYFRLDSTETTFDVNDVTINKKLHVVEGMKVDGQISVGNDTNTYIKEDTNNNMVFKDSNNPEVTLSQLIGMTNLNREIHSFTGDGTTKDFTLTNTPLTEVEVFYGQSVIQIPGVDYTLNKSTKTITFAVAPENGVKIVVSSLYLQ